MTKSNLETALMIAALPARPEARANPFEYGSTFGEHLVEAGRDRQEPTLAVGSKTDDVRSREATDGPSQKENSPGSEREDRVDANEAPSQVEETAGSQDDRAIDAADADDESVNGAATETAIAGSQDDAIPEAEDDDGRRTQGKNVRTESTLLQTGQELSSQEPSGALRASLEEEPAVEAKEQVQRDEGSTTMVGKETPNAGERQEPTVVDGKAGNKGKALDTTSGDGNAIEQPTSAEENQASKSASEQHDAEHDVAVRSSLAAGQASSASSGANVQNAQEKQGTRGASNRRDRRGDVLSRAGAGGQVGASDNGTAPRGQALLADAASPLESHHGETVAESNATSNNRGDSRSSIPTPVGRTLDFTSPDFVRSDKDAQAKRLSIDPERFVARVAKAFRLAEDRGGQLRLRLSPPELGSVRLELAVKNGAVTATIETETAAARHALLDNLPALRDRLAEQNMRVEQFDVHVRDEGADGRHEQTADNQGERHSPESGNERSNRQDQSDSTNRWASGNSAISRGDETLNVMV